MYGLVAEGLLQFRIQLGNFAQKRGLVIAQRVFNLIGHRELGIAQQARLPELHHAGTQLQLIGVEFFGCQGIFTAMGVVAAGQAAHFDVVPRRQQLGNVALRIQNAFALHFGGMRRQHGGYMAFGQGLGDGFGRDARPAQAGQSHLNAAFLRVSGALMDGTAANMVPVFRQIGQMAEIGESADDADRLVARQTFEQLFEGFVRRVVFVPPKRNRQFADFLNQIKRGCAFLLPNHVAQYAAQQADIFHQRPLIQLLFGERLRLGF